MRVKFKINRYCEGSDLIWTSDLSELSQDSVRRAVAAKEIFPDLVHVTFYKNDCPRKSGYIHYGAMSLGHFGEMRDGDV